MIMYVSVFSILATSGIVIFIVFHLTPLSDELIEMNDWELHDFAIQVVKDSLNNEGKKIISTQSSMDIDPSIWFEEEGEYFFVVVQATRFPDRRAAMPEIMAGSACMGKKVFLPL